MANGKISVIIPVFRTEQYLEKCICSVLAQTYENFEIVLVDDGSDDKCADICDEYASKDKRIRVIHKENGGLSSARNAGLKAADGEYVAFVDSDDYIAEHMYEVLVKNITQSDISMCGYYSVKGERIKENKGFDKITVLSGSEALTELLKDEKIKNHVWNKLFRRELFGDIEFPEGRTFEDILTTYKLFEKSEKVTYVPYAGYYYINRDGAISKKKDSETCFSRYLAHYLRYQDLRHRIPENEGIMLRQLFIQARAYMLSSFDKKSQNTCRIMSFFKENKLYITENANLDFFERKQTGFIACANKSAIKTTELFRKLKKLTKKLL